MRFIRNICALIILSLVSSAFIFNTITFAKNNQGIKIPKIFIDGDISEMNSKSDKRKIKFRYEDGGQTFESYAKIKIQGSASLTFEKKNYTVDFYENDSYRDKKDADFGWGEHSKYTLKANWDDKTNARNIVTARIAADINKKYNLFTSAPNYGETDGFPVEIYVDDDFFGLYTLNIPKSDWMFGMDKENAQNILFSSDLWGDSNLFKTEIGFDNAWDFELGDDEGYAVAQLNKAIDFIMNSTDEDFRQRIDDYFNLDSLLNYYVMTEFAELLDNTGKNMLVGTYDGNEWFLSLYDLNISWGVYFDTLLNYEEKSNIDNNLLFERLHKNFPNELANRYFALRKTILTKENILNRFYEFEAEIPESSKIKDQIKWGEAVGFDISQIEEFLDARIPYIDQFFYDLYTSDPEVYLRYETDKKNSLVKAILVTNREDIIIDELADENYELTFSENGVYKVSCRDWYGNYEESFNIEIDSITEQQEHQAPYYLVSIISSIACLAVAAMGFKTLSWFRCK